MTACKDVMLSVFTLLLSYINAKLLCYHDPQGSYRGPIRVLLGSLLGSLQGSINR